MIGFFVGIILGIVFFGGLYLTIGKLPESKRPSVLFLLSFVLRMAILLGGIYFLSMRGYKEVLFALLGILLIKFAMIFAVKRPKEKSTKLNGGE